VDFILIPLADERAPEEITIKTVHNAVRADIDPAIGSHTCLLEYPRARAVQTVHQSETSTTLTRKSPDAMV
jgi:hypothetical protein